MTIQFFHLTSQSEFLLDDFLNFPSKRSRIAEARLVHELKVVLDLPYSRDNPDRLMLPLNDTHDVVKIKLFHLMKILSEKSSKTLSPNSQELMLLMARVHLTYFGQLLKGFPLFSDEEKVKHRNITLALIKMTRMAPLSILKAYREHADSDLKEILITSISTQMRTSKTKNLDNLSS